MPLTNLMGLLICLGSTTLSSSFQLLSKYRLQMPKLAATSSAKFPPYSQSQYAEYITVPYEELLRDVEKKEAKLSSPTRTSFRNRYIGLRHGESEANHEGVISSDEHIGSMKHGLTAKGRHQSRQSAVALIAMLGREKITDTIFLTSNFTRARETGQECVAAINHIFAFENEPLFKSALDDPNVIASAVTIAPDSIQIQTSLRERYFGRLDATDLKFYNWVWPYDLLDASNERHGVESVNQVLERIAHLVSNLEKAYTDKVIVFVSHADTLQIAQMYFTGQDARTFSQFRFANGEVRELLYLPNPVSMVYK